MEKKYFTRSIGSKFDYKGKELTVTEAGDLDFCIPCYFNNGWSKKCMRDSNITGECHRAHTDDKKDRLFKIAK